jgi:F0F1-type ATP synthase membrane subunit c/vacuolar-type H+-ATPase subunit K
MNIYEQTLLICLISINISHVCCAGFLSGAGADIGINLGFNTWIDIKNTCAAIAKTTVSIAKNNPTATKTLLTGTGVAVGITCIVIPAIAAGYLGHRWYMKYQLYKEELALKEQARLLALRNAKIRDGAIIAVTATTTSIGLGYAIYRLYRSIQERRQQKKQEQQIFSARQELLTTLASHAREEEVGYWGVPTACEPCLHRLLALQGSGQALEEIASAYKRLPRANIALLPQQN